MGFGLANTISEDPVFVELMTADRALLKGVEADSVLYQSARGEHEILDDHVNFMGTVENGVIVVKSKGGVHYFGSSAGGFVNVHDGAVKLLLQEAVDLETLSKEQIKDEVQKIERRLEAVSEDSNEIALLNSQLLYQQALLSQKK